MTTEPTGTTNEADPDLPDAIARVTFAFEDRGWQPWPSLVEAAAEAAREDVPDLTRRLVEAEAKVARVEAALRLIGDEHITPVGARQIRAALADPMPDAATVGGGIPGSWTLDDEAGR